MKEQFVSYEIALELNKLGFDEPCIGHFHTKGDFKKELFINDNFKNIKLPFAVKAPLWQQVTDWFREKHNIHIVVSGKLIDSPKDKTYMWEVYGDFEEMPGELYEGLDKDYYISKEQAILKAIELIEK